MSSNKWICPQRVLDGVAPTQDPSPNKWICPQRVFVETQLLQPRARLRINELARNVFFREALWASGARGRGGSGIEPMGPRATWLALVTIFSILAKVPHNYPA